ncbi:MAG: hypothetical protein IJK64_04270 [Clostridia bacterium]|nr:hypothetical protein [Clostridia bacterium]
MKKLLSVLVALTMVLALVPSAILAGAYMNVPTTNVAIYTPQDLLNFCAQLSVGNTQYANANVVLKNTIDMRTLNNGNYTFKTGPFNGIFYGEGFSIAYLNSDVGGLFTAVETGAGVENLIITHATITNNDLAFPTDYVGAIANYNLGVIKDCTVMMSTITADVAAVGGIAGSIGGGLNQSRSVDYTMNQATDFNTDPSITEPADACIVNCTVSSTDIKNTRNALINQGSTQTSIAGGIAGRTDGGFIENCEYLEGKVVGLRVGGILGFAQAGTLIRFCENTGTVVQNLDLMATVINYEERDSGSTSYVYNLLLDNGYSVEKMCLEYKVFAGGILGGDPNRYSHVPDPENDAMYVGDYETSILNCMNYGPVKGAVNVGGIAGMITNPYFMMANCGNDYLRQVHFEEDDTWDIIRYDSSIAGYFNVGGLVGYLAGGYMGHAQYAAQGDPDHAPDSVIYNSYNAMAFTQNTDLGNPVIRLAQDEDAFNFELTEIENELGSVFRFIISQNYSELFAILSNYDITYILTVDEEGSQPRWFHLEHVIKPYNDATIGGLVGKILDKATIENCHNAGRPLDSVPYPPDPEGFIEDPGCTWLPDVNGTGNFGIYGSLIGDVAGKFFMAHCFGAVKVDEPTCKKLIGKETATHSASALFQNGTTPTCIDTEAYVLETDDMPLQDGTINGNSSWAIDPYNGPFNSNPNENLVCQPDNDYSFYPLDTNGFATHLCGGVIIPYRLAPSATGVYSTASIGSMTMTRDVMRELQAYQSTYQITNQRFEGHRLSATANFAPWVCLEGAHHAGYTVGCTYYAVFENGFSGKHFDYTSPVFPPAPTGPFFPILEPGVVIPDDPPGADELLPGSTAPIGHSLLLEGDIGVNFYVDVPYASSEAYAEFSFGGDTIQVPIDLNQYDTTADNVKRYKFTCNVNSSQISMQISGIVRNHVMLPDYEIDGWYESDPFTYSVTEYVEAISVIPYYQSQPALMDLMRAISVYGYYANELLHTDPGFVQSTLFDDNDLDTYTSAALADYQPSTEDYGPAISYYGSSLMLTSATAIRHYFLVDPAQMNGHTIDEYTFIWEGPDGDVPLTPTANGSYYYVEIPNIQSGNLGKIYTVRVYQPVDNPGDDPLVSKWCFAGLSYAYKVLLKSEQGGNVTPEQVQIAKALGLYYNCAHAYFG